MHQRGHRFGRQEKSETSLLASKAGEDEEGSVNPAMLLQEQEDPIFKPLSSSLKPLGAANSPKAHQKQQHQRGGCRAGGFAAIRHSELVAGACYCTMSTIMVLLNKHVLSGFHFECPNSLLLFQCSLTAVLVKSCEFLGLVPPLERLSWSVVRAWLPANFVFVAMIWTSFFALKYLNVAMVTVLKNLTNLVTIVGDYMINGKSYPGGVWLTLSLMVASAFVGASTDLTFNVSGYSWQIANCLATASYSLYLRLTMDKVQVGEAAHAWDLRSLCLLPLHWCCLMSGAPPTAATQLPLQGLSQKSGGFDEFSMVWYNNILSIPLLMILVICFGEHKILLHEPALERWYGHTLLQTPMSLALPLSRFFDILLPFQSHVQGL